MQWIGTSCHEVLQYAARPNLPPCSNMPISQSLHVFNADYVLFCVEQSVWVWFSIHTRMNDHECKVRIQAPRYVWSSGQAQSSADKSACNKRWCAEALKCKPWNFSQHPICWLESIDIHLASWWLSPMSVSKSKRIGTRRSHVTSDSSFQLSPYWSVVQTSWRHPPYSL